MGLLREGGRFAKKSSQANQRVTRANRTASKRRESTFEGRGTIRQKEQSSKSTSFQGESDRLKKNGAIFNGPLMGNVAFPAQNNLERFAFWCGEKSKML